MSNKYAGIVALQTFLDNLRNLFATKTQIEEAKSYTDTKTASILESAQTYADEAASQKTQVQFITWEAND